MKQLNKIKLSFIRQRNERDCGIACLKSILRYAGIDKQWSELYTLFDPAKSITLLDLKKAAGRMGLEAKCMQLDVEHLRACVHPCILHVFNTFGEAHFVVCYGYRKSRKEFRYLIGDPAGQLQLRSEKQVSAQWKSKAALVLEQLPVSDVKIDAVPGTGIFGLTRAPRELLWSIPFLALMTAVLGSGITLVLEKGTEISSLVKSQPFCLLLLTLLLLVTLFKSLLTYLRDRLLIRLNAFVNDRLMNHLIGHLFSDPVRQGVIAQVSVEAAMADIQKVQRAVIAVTAVILSDGFLLLALLAGITYLDSITAVINLLFVLLSALVTIWFLPVRSNEQSRLQALTARNQKELLSALSDRNDKENSSPHLDRHAALLAMAKRLAIRISKFNLIYECLSVACLMSAVAQAIMELQTASISYTAFITLVILTYICTMLTLRILTAFYTVADGAEAGRLYMERLGSPL